MESNTTIPDFVDRSRLLTIIGVLLLVGGVAVGLLGPVEMYSFYLFSKGGRFHYQGFGFGSFMFANIASQIIGYYLIAIILITLGYGHLKLRQWARVLALAWLWSWLVVGGPLIMVVFFILVGSKDLSFPVALISLIFLGLSYLIFPGLLIRFYKGRNVCKTLETNDTKKAWIETLPIPILVLSSLYSFYLIMFHILILFNGMFPVFGNFRFGLQGIVLLDISIAGLVCIIWGNPTTTTLGLVGLCNLVRRFHVLNGGDILQIQLFRHLIRIGISTEGNGNLGWITITRLSFFPSGRNTFTHNLGNRITIKTAFQNGGEGLKPFCKIPPLGLV
jgi:MFS family permease